MEKIAPPKGLMEALTRAVNYESLDAKASAADWAVAEGLIYSQPFQEYLHHERQEDATETAQEPAGPREPVKVVCTVAVPMSSPPAAVHALSAVPIDARLAYEQTQGGLIAGFFGVGSIVATWTEER